MTDIELLDGLKHRGAHMPASEDLRALYRQAFRDFGVRALWSSRAVEKPTIADVLAITESLRVEGGISGRRLAEEIVRMSRAAHDIDVFHDREDAMQEAMNADAAVLERNGLTMEWVRRFPAIGGALVRQGSDGVLLEWVVDSAYRFFPALKDELFGYVLHPADIATNKALAAAGRREPRDIIDLLTIHEKYLPLGAVAWAACAKDPGFSPEGLIAEIRRNGRYQQADYDRLLNETPIDAAATSRALHAALQEADAFARSMPAGKEGVLFLDDRGRPVQPEVTTLDSYTPHGGHERGHWPSSAEITHAMLERYNQQLER